jgi:hypothetical protein
MAKPQYSGPWQRIRRTILERDGYLCQINGPGCTTTANQVDHIRTIHNGGAWFDPTNLRASCATCNNKRPDNRRTEQWRTAKTRIVLVIGPPGAGKTTWVEENQGPNDLVVDYDKLAGAIGGGAHPDQDAPHNPLHEATSTARNAILRGLRQGKYNVGRAWIISANPNAEGMFPYHRVVVIDPGLEKVLERLKVAGRPGKYQQLARDWYAKRNGGEVTDDGSRPW